MSLHGVSSSSSSSGGTGTGVNASDVGFDIILLMGQSNMAGRGTVDTYVDVVDSRVSQYGSDSNNTNTLNKICQAIDPLSHAENASTAGTGVGPGMPFARAYAASIPTNRKVLLVPTAVGSTALVGGPWAPNAGANSLTNAISQAQNALTAAKALYPASRIVGALWAQGEQDANNGVSASTYATTLQALISEVRTNLSVPKMWFMIHGMNPDYVAQYPAYQTIQTALQNVATNTNYCYFVAGPTGASYDNGVHYTSAAYRILGSKSALLVPTASAYLAPTADATKLTVSLSSSSVPVNTQTTITINTDNPLTGSQTITANVSEPVAGSASATSVTLNSSTTSGVQITFTPSAQGSGNVTATQASGTPTVTSGSAAITVTAAATAPAQMSAPTATAGSTSASLAFTLPSDGGHAITSLTITPYIGATGQTPITTTTLTSPYVVTGLTAGTAYTFTMHATNDIGSGTESAASNSVTPTAASATTWNPSDANAHIVLTSSNLQATTTTGTASGWESVRSTVGKSAGKWYWETKDLNAGNVIVGIGDASTSLSNFAGNAGNSYGYYNSGSTFHNNASAGFTGASWTTNDVIGHALDMDNKTYQLFKNGVSQGTITGLPSATMYAMMSAQDGSPAPGVLANFGATAFTYTPPSGFSGLA